MAAQSRVLTNGRWTPETMKISYLISQEEAPAPLQETHDRISGILTRRVANSPVVKWILPARIRHKSKDDVIFISEDSIEIKEFVGARRLQNVAVKSDFDSKIRAARIFGDPRSPPLSKNRFGDDDHGSENEVATDNMDLDLDASQQSTTSDKVIPPQVLVLSLQSKSADSIAFIFAYQDHGHDQIQWVSSLRALPSVSPDPPGRLGASLAVDPRSRAMAVASHVGYLTIYSLKSKAKMQNEIDHPSSLPLGKFEPVYEERTFELNAVITKMEFLHPPNDGAHDRTVLLLVTVCNLGQKPSRTTLKLYEWDCFKSLREIEVRWSGYPLPDQEKHPLLLIPLTISPGFILVCKYRMYIYRNVMLGYSDPESVQYNETETPSDEPGSSRMPPVFTGWARPLRHQDHAKMTDSWYLCRSDGAFQFYTMSATDGITMQHHVGTVDVNTDSAFACLDAYSGDTVFEHGSFDMLVISGSNCDGGMFEFKPRVEMLPRVQRMPNWAPVEDFAVVPRINSASSTHSLVHQVASRNVISNDRIFACADTSMKHGTICEIQYGVEAQTVFRIALEELDKSSSAGALTKMWLFPDNSPIYGEDRRLNDQATLLVAHPESTAKYSISFRGQIVIPEPVSYLDSLIDTQRRTVTASTTSDGLAIVILEHSIRALKIPDAGCTIKSKLDYKMEAGRIIHASVEGRSSKCLFSVGNQSSITLNLMALISLKSEDKTYIQPSVGASVLLSAETSSLLLVECSPNLCLALAGTQDRKLSFFSEDNGALGLDCEYIFTGDEVGAICDSICVIKKPASCGDQELPMVLCGLRDGTLHVLELSRTETGELKTVLCDTLEFGLTSVSVFPEIESQSNTSNYPESAIVVCGEIFCRLAFVSEDVTKLSAQCIWITHTEPHSIAQSPVTSIAQYNSWDDNLATISRVNKPSGFSKENNLSTFSKTLFCVDQNSARLVRLEAATKSVAQPRGIHINGSPSRVIYAKKLQKLIVAFEHLYVPEAQPTNGFGKVPERRLRFPMLRILDPDENDFSGLTSNVNSQDASSPPPGALVVGESGERVLGISEWLPEVNKRTWSLLVINTTRPRKNGAQEQGRITICSAFSSESEVKISIEKKFDRAEPITALAPFGDSFLAYCAGDSLTVEQLVMEDGSTKLRQVDTVNLRSPGIAISIHEDCIFVTTALHSIVVFKFMDSKLVESLNDSVARKGQHHLFLPDQSFILASNRDGTVRGLYKPPSDPTDGSLIPVFEASLPGHITRIRASSLGPTRTLPSGRASNSIIGSTFDGAFFSFEFLSRNEWFLLSFIQNLLKRMKAFCPYTSQNHLNLRIEPEEKVSNMHIDGDILSRLFRYRKDERLRQFRSLIAAPVAREARFHDYPSAEDRQARFVELAKAALQEMHPALDQQDPYEAVLSYLAGMLEINV